MKRTLTIFAVVALMAIAAVGVAFAWGPGSAGPGNYGPGRAGGARGGHGMMGGRMGGGGYGMMGGRMNANLDFDFAYCDGENYDPAAMLTQAEQMLAQRKDLLATLESQLAAAPNEAQKSWVAARIELQKILIAWSEGRIPLIKTLPADDWLKGATTMAQYDVDYFSNATANDAGNKSFIANRLSFAQQRLDALKAQASR